MRSWQTEVENLVFILFYFKGIQRTVIDLEMNIHAAVSKAAYFQQDPLSLYPGVGNGDISPSPPGKKQSPVWGNIFRDTVRNHNDFSSGEIFSGISSSLCPVESVFTALPEFFKFKIPI